MIHDIKRTLGWAGLLIGAMAAVVVANQFVQFAQFARSLHPLAGDAVSIGLVVLAGAAIVTPMVIVMRLPKALVPPPEADREAVIAYQAQLRHRLSTNRHLGADPIDLSSDDGLKAAIHRLDQRADQLTGSPALSVNNT